MPKEKVNYQEVYDLYQLCSETKDLLRRVSGSTASIQRQTLRGSSSA